MSYLLDGYQGSIYNIQAKFIGAANTQRLEKIASDDNNNDLGQQLIYGRSSLNKTTLKELSTNLLVEKIKEGPIPFSQNMKEAKEMQFELHEGKTRANTSEANAKNGVICATVLVG